jgi:lincosamide nucleotidyltransferase A/C/D/E
VFPRSSFVTGSLTGVPVPCVSVAAQRLFHTGYELRSIDVHDLAVLDELDRGGQTYSGGNQLD